VDHRAGLDDLVKKKTLWLMPGIESRFLCHSVQIVVTVPTELSWLQHISYSDKLLPVFFSVKVKSKVVRVHIKKAYRLN